MGLTLQLKSEIIRLYKQATVCCLFSALTHKDSNISEVKEWKKQFQLSSLRKWSSSNNIILLRQKVSLEVKRGIS